MSSKYLAVLEPTATKAVMGLVLDSVDSPHTRRAYARALSDFLAWYGTIGRRRFDRATVQRYAAELHADGVSPTSVNQRLSAIRKLAVEAALNGALSDQVAAGIRSVKSIRQNGVRVGNWLSQAEAQQLLDSPDTCALRGLRDRAVLAVLLGCGLRRSEAAALTVQHVQQREGRWVLVDLIGKRGKVRSVPMPSWCRAALESWTSAAGITDGRIFRSFSKDGRVVGERITPQAIADIVRRYAPRGIAAHDLRRTFAKLARKGDAAIEQIQLSLGHESISTTQRYLGLEQDLTDAPCDRLGLRLG